MITDEKNRLVASFLFVGLILVGFSVFYAFQTKQETFGRALAQAELVTGKATVFRKGFLKKEPLTKRSSVYNLDSLETSDTGEALLSFDNLLKIRLSHNTLVTLEKAGDDSSLQIIIYLKRGDLKVEGQPRDQNISAVSIAKNGEVIPAVYYNTSELSQVPTQEIPATPIPTASQSLSDGEISGTLSGHRNQFFKCYTQLLQTQPQAKGDIALGFTIERTGKVSVVEITSPHFLPHPEVDKFKNCLRDVLLRVEFKSFDGQPISTLFPLKFE